MQGGFDDVPAGLIECAWPAPPGVRAVTTTRAWRGAWPTDVAENAKLIDALALPAPPFWLSQVHGVDVVRIDARTPRDPPHADAAVTSAPGIVLAVRHADCLPVVLANDDASAIGIAHAGWRGLAEGVIEATLAALPGDASRLIAWLGPCAGAAHYEVDAAVRDALLARGGDTRAERAFVPTREGHWLCDLALLATLHLRAAGVLRITDCGWSTIADTALWHSHRRDGAAAGRHATLVWITPPFTN